ncbi:MAG: RidA family protein [Lysobacterales bacterium]|nr:MAG: RidA family protein [Xanthomonadales bacterium]
MKAAIVLCTCVCISVASALSAAAVTVEHYGEDPALQMPFSDAVRVGDMLYLSGKIGNLPGTSELAPGGIQGETRQTMENIKASLEKYGSSLDEVVKCTVFLADMAEWGAMNEVYVTYFPGNKPARSALGASGLALGARVEIECLAAMR